MYDFHLTGTKILIECDEGHHFTKELEGQRSINQSNDIYKMIRANLNGYSCIRINEDDISNNSSYCKEELNKIINLNFDQPVNTVIKFGKKYDYSYATNYNKHYEACYDEYIIDHNDINILERQLMDYLVEKHGLYIK
jgi:hypothetical protein